MGLLKHDPNEVYCVVHMVKDKLQLATEQASVKVEGSHVLRKRMMTMVNDPYPSRRNEIRADLGVPRDGALYCRWKHVVVTKTGKVNRPLDAFHIPAAEIHEASFQRLRIEECDGGHNNSTTDEILRRSWLGAKKREGAYVESKDSDSLESAIESLSLDHNNRNERIPAAYTFADVCCGAGGASHGAQMAGLRMRWALDHNAAACETYRLNFSGVRLYHKELQDAVRMWREDFTVDIMHFSPPCQAFSQANTNPNPKNDIVNIAANKEIGIWLGIARPRIATLEQTEGLMNRGRVGKKHSEHWDNLIEQFTSKGYSVSWKIVNLAEFGLPQARKRLIMIASCPGEPLPAFPKSTHAEHPSKTGLRPFTSVKDSIGSIPPDCPNHEIPRNLKRPREPYDENGLLPHVVTTTTACAHPSGDRKLSLREHACVQGFPLKYRFPKTALVEDIRKQIGNAFPPPAAEVLFADIKRQLLVRDGYKLR